MMKVLFAASECVPFVKTGGLADVVGALPKEILKNNVDVRVILPLYREIPTVMARQDDAQALLLRKSWLAQAICAA